VTFLLDCIQETNIPNIVFIAEKNELPPLEIAVQNGRKNVVNAFLSFAKHRLLDANIVFNISGSPSSPVQRASFQGQDSVTQQILDMPLKFAYDNVVRQEKNKWTI
jgi:hypothetical protein